MSEILSRAKARGRRIATITRVKRGVTKQGKPMWLCLLVRGGKTAWIFEDQLDTVWAGTKYADLFRGMAEDEWLSFWEQPIEVAVETNYSGHLSVKDVGVDFTIQGYFHAAMHAGSLNELLTGDREQDEAVGAEEGGRLHCWGLVARIYREFDSTPWSGADENDGDIGLAELIEYIWDGIDGGIPKSALIAIVNAVYANYCDNGGRQLLGMPAHEGIWGQALDEWQRAGTEEDIREFVNWDAIELG